MSQKSSGNFGDSHGESSQGASRKTAKPPEAAADSGPGDAQSPQSREPVRVAPEASKPPAISAGDGVWSPPGYDGLRIGWALLGDAFKVQCWYVHEREDLFVDTTVDEENPQVLFSLRQDLSPTPFLSGQLCFDSSSGDPTLSVKDLKYPGGLLSHEVLCPPPTDSRAR